MADLMPQKNPMDLWEENSKPKPCCVHLRCKSMYYRDDERPGLLHVDEAMGFWCGVTNDDLGPDKHAATHKACQSGRPCFVKGPGAF